MWKIWKIVELAKLTCQNFKRSTKSQRFRFYIILVKSPCVARFYHKLIEYTFYLINNNLSNNYYNKKWKKNLV